jgi:hypothetical protein
MSRAIALATGAVLVSSLALAAGDIPTRYSGSFPSYLNPARGSRTNITGRLPLPAARSRSLGIRILSESLPEDTTRCRTLADIGTIPCREGRNRRAVKYGVSPMQALLTTAYAPMRRAISCAKARAEGPVVNAVVKPSLGCRGRDLLRGHLGQRARTFRADSRYGQRRLP